MIALYGFGPAMGLPEISPFVTKAHILLRMAGLQYETSTNVGGFLKAPKGKLPYMRDGAAVVSDSTLIRPQCIIGTQISDILDVTRTRLPDHAARVSGSRLSGRMPSTS